MLPVTWLFDITAAIRLPLWSRLRRVLSPRDKPDVDGCIFMKMFNWYTKRARTFNWTRIDIRVPEIIREWCNYKIYKLRVSIICRGSLTRPSKRLAIAKSRGRNLKNQFLLPATVSGIAFPVRFLRIVVTVGYEEDASLLQNDAHDSDAPRSARMWRQLSTFVSPPRYDIPASRGRARGWRTVRCDGVLLTAHDVLIIATDGDDDAGTYCAMRSGFFALWMMKARGKERSCRELHGGKPWTH